MALESQIEAAVGGESDGVLWIPDDAGMEVDELLSSWKASYEPSSAPEEPLRSVSDSPSPHSAPAANSVAHGQSIQPGDSSVQHVDTGAQAASPVLEELEEWLFQDLLQGPGTAEGDFQAIDRLSVEAGAEALLDELQALPSCGLPDPFIPAPFSPEHAVRLGSGVQASGESSFRSLLEGLDGLEGSFWEAPDSGSPREPYVLAGTPFDDEVQALSAAGTSSDSETVAAPSTSGGASGSEGRSSSSELESDLHSSSVSSDHRAGLRPVPPSHRPQAEPSVPPSLTPDANHSQAPDKPLGINSRGQTVGQPTDLTMRLAAVVRGLTSNGAPSTSSRHTSAVHSANPAPLAGSTRANASRLLPAADGFYNPATAGHGYRNAAAGFTGRPGFTGPQSKEASGPGGGGGVCLSEKGGQKPLWSGFTADAFAVTKGDVSATARPRSAVPPVPRASAKVPVSAAVASGAPARVGLPEPPPAVSVSALQMTDYPVAVWSAAQGRRRRADSDIHDNVYSPALKRDPSQGMARAGSPSETGARIPLEPNPGTPAGCQTQVLTQGQAFTQSQALVWQATAGSVTGALEVEEDEGGSESQLFRLGLWALARRYRRYTGGAGGSSGPASSSGLGGANDFCVTYALVASPPASLALDSALLPPRPSNPTLKRRVSAQLIQLATAYAADQPRKVQALCQRLEKVASPHGCATQKLVHYVLRALEMRREGKGVPAAALQSMAQGVKQVNVNNFVNLTGWAPFAEIITTYTISRALRGHSKVHIILISDWASICWPALLRDLASQPGGAPSVRVTSINFLFPDPGSSEMQSTILRRELRTAADANGVPLLYEPLRVPHFSFHPGLVRTDPSEAVAVVSAWHLMMFPDSQVLKSNPRNAMLKVFVLLEGDADFNTQFFLPRFKELLLRGVTVFEAIDSRIPEGDPHRGATEFLFSQDVTNCIACEGLDRFLRMERAEQWGDRLSSVGFKAAKFPQQVWDSLSVFSGIDPRVNVSRDGEIARLQWLGVSHVFGSAWVPG